MRELHTERKSAAVRWSVAVLLVTALAGTLAAQGNGYAYHRPIVIDHTKVANTVQSNFPVLISGVISELAAGANRVRNSNGWDIIFTSDTAGNSPLSFERERYVASTGEVCFWVKVPTLSPAADTTLYLWYGNAAVSADTATPTQVWNSGAYKGVWHLPNGSILSAADSTSNGNNGTILNGSAGSGKIGGSLLGTAAGGSNVVIPSMSAALTGNQLTMSMWVNGSYFGNNQAEMGNEHAYFTGTGAVLLANDYIGSGASFQSSAGGGTSIYGGTITTNAWYYVVGTYDGSATRLYLNGVQVASGVASGNLSVSSNPFYLGRLGMDARMDEVRVALSARSADWIVTEYNNQNSPSTFYSVGAEIGIPPPAITSLSVTWGLVGTQVTITGTNFGATKGSSSVTFNGITASSVWNQDGTITATVPANATTGNVVVIVGGLSSIGVPFTVAGQAAAAGYTYSRPIVISHIKVPNTPQTNFPVLISDVYSYLANAPAGKVQNPNGWDIIFTSDAAGIQPLSFERERYVAATGEVSFWVKVPLLSPTLDTTIYLWYGNVAVSADTATPAQVWDSGYKGVWHLPNGTTLSVADSTSNGYNGAILSAAPAVGKIGGSLLGTAAGGNSVSIPSLSAVLTGNQLTMSMWVNGSWFANSAEIGNEHAAFTGTGACLFANDYVGSSLTFQTSAAGGNILSGGTLTTNAWHYAVGVYDGSTMRLYLNGAQVASTAVTGNLSVSANPFYLGRYGVEGRMDEVRVSLVARSADWIATEYNNQNSPSTFYTVGSESGSATPAITSLSVTSGLVGTPVTITGESFGTSQGTVKFNGVTATVTSWNATTILVTVPMGATTGSVVVTVGGVPITGPLFTVSVGTPTLSLPADLAVAQPMSTTLSWSATGGATSYTIYLDTANPPVAHYIVQTGTSYTASLQGGDQYYWYVVGNSGAVVGPPSPPRTFWVTGVPSAVSLTLPAVQQPAASGTFAFKFHSPNGWQDSWVQLDFNYWLVAAGACFVDVWPASNQIALSTDDGLGWIGIRTLGPGQQALQNSQCSIDLGNSSILASSPTDNTVNLAVTFLPGLPGPQQIFAQVGDNTGATQGWQQMGTWTTSTVQNIAPVPVSITPPNESWSGSGGVFTFRVSSVNGASYLTDIDIIFTTGSTLYLAPNACRVDYSRISGMMSIENDAGGYDPGVQTQLGEHANPAIIQNSQCSINAVQSSITAVVGDPLALDLNLAITFKTPWVGTSQPAYLYVFDRKGYCCGGGWLQQGPYTITAPSTTITSSPPAQQITVDGASYTTPHTFPWTAGTVHTLAAPSSISGTGIQGTFSGWSDAGAQSHAITIGASGTYTAIYTTQYYLTTAVSGTGTVTPSSGWHAAGSQVTLAATPGSGNVFSSFSGTVNDLKNPLPITMNGPMTETAQFETIYTISVLKGTDTVSPGGTATFLLSVQPSGYPGALVSANLLLSCHANPSMGGWAWLPRSATMTSNGDGTVMLQMAVAQPIYGGCPGTQYDVTIPVVGVSPQILPQNLPLTLYVQSSNTLSISAVPISQTAGSVTYGIQGYANFSGAVALGVQVGTCARLMGSPTMSMAGTGSQTVATSGTLSVATSGCPAGMNVPLTITASGGGTNATAPTTLQIVPNTAVMTSPPPGATIPGGPTVFSWNTLPGATYCLYAGAGQQATCSGSVLPGAQVTLPTSGTAFATLGTQVGGTWQYQQYAYNVNPTPTSQTFTVDTVKSKTASVPTNGQPVDHTYFFTAGDPSTLTSVTANVVGVNVQIVHPTLGTSQAAGTLRLRFTANSNVAANRPITVTAQGAVGMVAWGGGGTVFPPLVSVQPERQPVGRLFEINGDDVGGSGEVEVCDPNGICMTVCTFQNGVGTVSCPYTASQVGTYLATFWMFEPEGPEDSPYPGFPIPNSATFTATLPISVSLPAKVVVGANGSFTIDATVQNSDNYPLVWSIDNGGLLSTPIGNCANQASCQLTAGQAGGKGTIKLTIQDGTGSAPFATMRLIVVQISKLDVVVANHVNGGQSPTATMSFKDANSTLGLGVLPWPPQADPQWNTIRHLVLVQGSVPQIALQVTSTPLATDADVKGYVKFSVIQSADDVNQGNIPTTIPGDDPNQSSQASVVLSPSSASSTYGSYQILVFVDSDGNSSRDVGETGIAVPLILVQATLHKNLSSSPNMNIQYVRGNDAWGADNTKVRVQSSGDVLCDQQRPQTCPVVLAAEVDLVGGGADGRRGTTQVFGGWVQDVDSPGIVGTYNPGPHYARDLFASNQPPPGQANFFIKGDTINTLAGPLLDYYSDVLNDPAVGVGGNTSLMSTSLQDLMVLALVDFNPDPLPALGRRILITATDKPWSDFYSRNPGYTASLLTGVQYNVSFTSYLTLWASATGQQPGNWGTPPPSPANGDLTLECADHTYAVLMKLPWNIVSTFQPIDASGHADPMTVIGAGVGFMTTYGPVPASSTPVILVPPIAKAASKVDVSR